ncbi:MAG: cytochrome c biogenesis protein CcdA [Succinivibrio sp.]
MIRILFFVTAALLSLSAVADDDFDSLFQMPDLTFNSQAHLPYTLDCQQNADKVKCNVKLEKGAYVYADSFKIESDTVSFLISSVPAPVSHTDASGTSSVYDSSFDFEIKINNGKADDILNIHLKMCDEKGICFPVQTNTFCLTDTVAGRADKIGSDSPFFNEDNNFLILLLLCIIFGAALDLTPCLMPMLSIYSATILGCQFKSLPHTVRLNVAYILGMAVSFSLLGLIFAQLGVAAHGVLQHPVSVVIMSSVMLLFALDCLGIISIRIPSLFNSRIEKTISSQKSGSPKKAFLFGVLSSLIATPCTSAPLAGALLYVISTNSVIRGMLLFFCLGLGMALPLVIIGIFGSRYLSFFRDKTTVIRNLLAIPLFLGAFFISSHLFGEYEHFAFSVVVAICITSTLGILLHSRRLSIILSCCLFVFALTFGGIYKYHKNHTDSSVFTTIKTLDDLKKYHGKKIVLTFSAKWCSNCHQLDETLYSSQEFLSAAEDYRLLRFDITDTTSPENTQICKKFDVIGVPYLVIIDAAGEIKSATLGTVDKVKVLELLEAKQN